ncbi:monovalent cation/H(+) antiporter subunit G [Methanoregula sp.]|uniref:monovalent cation/H(+) antiporter subunit G n=1 Tax=Methanoregula sp. TaxID=2052170 RepID=UPI00262F08CB|nr:monovalent cation/H(+) antiporter subunit G [Methanoregula sp.]MDD5144170.1 monovalent cation/H(+) antiporter subunit G [Methanoregula sp.]
MSSFLFDIAIWLLLFGAFVFGVLGFFGLLIFPDIRSRMFTASRASLIAAGLVVVSVLLYGINAYRETGLDIYLALLAHTVLLVLVLCAGTNVVTRIVKDAVAETILPLDAKK